MSARSGGKSAAGPVGVDAEADDDARVVRSRARPTRRGRRPPCARSSASCGAIGTAGPDGLDDEVVGPLQADRPVGQPGDLLGGVGHRQRGRRRQAPGVGRGQPVGRKPRLRSSAAPAGATHERPSRPRPGRLLVGDGEADLGRAGGQPGAHDVVGRADAGEALLAGEEVGHRAVRRTLGLSRPRRPRSAPGCSRSKASCSARRAVSSSSSAIMHVIRTSEVEIISMLTPASARVPNMRAA